ncbi:MAG: hypothetical protein ABIY47_10500 [Opitutaceae bacterium]
MSRLRHFVALLLLALWLPATLHCGVEALGWDFGSGCCADGESPAAATKTNAGCESDGCGTIESGFRAPSSFAAAPAPWLSFAICFWTVPPSAGLAPLSPPATGVVEALAAPPEISRCRVFVMRAALLPGAPCPA